MQTSAGRRVSVQVELFDSLGDARAKKTVQAGVKRCCEEDVAPLLDAALDEVEFVASIDR